MSDEKELLIRIRADIKNAVAELKKISGEVQTTGRNAKRASSDVSKLSKSFSLLRDAAGAYFSFQVAKNIVLQADSFSLLQARVKLATEATRDYADVSARIYEISQENGVQLETTVGLFQGLARIAPELEASNEEILTLVRLVQQLGVISGANPTNLSAGLLQFTQAMASGVLRAEEFNSILENIPEVGARIAKGLGLSVGQLRLAVLEGKVLSQDVFRSLLEQSSEISDQFEKMPQSVQRSATSFTNSLQNLLAAIDQSVTGTGLLASFLGTVAKGMDNLAKDIRGDDLDRLQQRRAQLAQIYTRLMDDGFRKSDAAITRLRQLIDEVDERIIELEKKRQKAQEGGEGQKNTGGGTVDTDKPDAIERRVQALEREEALIGATRVEAELYTLAQKGATDAQLERARVALEAAESEKAFADEVRRSEEAVKAENAAYNDWIGSLRSEGQSVYESVRNEQETLNDELARLEVLLNAGAISWETYHRAVAKAEKRFQDISAAGETTLIRLADASRIAVRSMEGFFEEGFFDIMEGRFDDLGRSFELMLKRMVAQIAANRLAFSLFGNPNAPGAVPPGGHAHGGYITGPGTATSDSIPAMLSDGEYVMPARAVDHYGLQFFERIRKRQLPRFASGGLVVPFPQPVAHFSEGGLARAGGAGGDIRIELKNSGAPKSVTDVQPRFDGRSLVLQVVTEDAQRNGPITETIVRKVRSS